MSRFHKIKAKTGKVILHERQINVKNISVAQWVTVEAGFKDCDVTKPLSYLDPPKFQADSVICHLEPR